jgi:hypothetical protein
MQYMLPLGLEYPQAGHDCGLVMLDDWRVLDQGFELRKKVKQNKLKRKYTKNWEN